MCKLNYSYVEIKAATRLTVYAGKPTTSKTDNPLSPTPTEIQIKIKLKGRRLGVDKFKNANYYYYYYCAHETHACQKQYGVY